MQWFATSYSKAMAAKTVGLPLVALPVISLRKPLLLNRIEPWRTRELAKQPHGRIQMAVIILLHPPIPTMKIRDLVENFDKQSKLMVKQRFLQVKPVARMMVAGNWLAN